MWVTKTFDTFQQEYKIQHKILEAKGIEHSLELFSSLGFSQIALLDEGVLLQDLLCTQSELLAHIAACSHKNPKRVLIVGSFNIEIAFEFLRHEGLQVDFLQFDLKVLESLISFFPHYKEVMDSKRFKLIPQKREEFLKQNEGENAVKYDIIVALDNFSVENLLDDSGILITKAPQILLQTNNLKESLEQIGDFRIKMPFFAPLSLQQDCYIFASRHYHPTADLQLQRADMLENLQYYHANLHLSAFVLPKSVKDALLGVAKN